MKTIYRIARIELISLFFSPMAWIVLIILTFQSGLTFTDQLQKLRFSLEGQSATGKLFGSVHLFYLTETNLYLYIPLLTMGVMSREISSGSIKLLLSSPIKIREIILGKYLALMAYGFLLVLILSFFAIAGAFSINHIDTGLILSGLLGIYLLICAYSAIGLFISCLTPYQMVAAISTLALIAALNYLNNIAQYIDWIRKITYFLSIEGRSDKFNDGLINSKDVIYFIIIVVLFLQLSVIILQRQQERKSLIIVIGKYALLVSISFLAVYITSNPTLVFYGDLTANKTQTLTNNSQEVIKKLKSPLKITYFINLFDTRYHTYSLPEKRNSVFSRWEQYQRFLPDLQIDYIYYYDTKGIDLRTYNSYQKANPEFDVKGIANLVANKMHVTNFLNPDEIRKKIDLSREDNLSVRLLQYRDQKVFLREYLDLFQDPGEGEIIAAIKRLIVIPPKILFLVGDNERSIDKAGDQDYEKAVKDIKTRNALINQGFDVDTISLNKDTIPKGITALVIADPTVKLGVIELEKIQKYISSGGNLLIAGEPGKQSLLNPLIAQFGVKLMDGILLEQSKDFAPDFILAKFSQYAASYSTVFQSFRSDSIKLSMPGAVGLEYTYNKGYDIHPVVFTDEKSTWNHIGTFKPSPGINYNPAQGDNHQSVPAGVALTRKVGNKEQRIIIMGDADFMSNIEITRKSTGATNLTFMTEMFKWFSYEQFPIDVQRPEPKDNKLTTTRKDVFLWKTVFLGVIPGLFFLLGALLLFNRNKR